jgi:YHS domain-containing protein
MKDNAQMTSDRLSRFALAFAAALLLAACQTFNTTSEGADANLMLKGHDPVAYFTDGRHVPGKPDIKADHEGVTYRFATAEHRDLFVKQPDRYAPQFGGFCANGIAYAIPWGGDPDTWKIIEGKLYIFGGEASRRYFLMDERQNLALANSYWANEVKGSHPRMQTAKRLVFRVPHYKTGKELEAEWQAKNAKK